MLWTTDLIMQISRQLMLDVTCAGMRVRCGRRRSVGVWTVCTLQMLLTPQMLTLTTHWR